MDKHLLITKLKNNRRHKHFSIKQKIPSLPQVNFCFVLLQTDWIWSFQDILIYSILYKECLYKIVSLWMKNGTLLSNQIQSPIFCLTSTHRGQNEDQEPSLSRNWDLCSFFVVSGISQAWMALIGLFFNHVAIVWLQDLCVFWCGRGDAGGVLVWRSLSLSHSEAFVWSVVHLLELCCQSLITPLECWQLLAAPVWNPSCPGQVTAGDKTAHSDWHAVKNMASHTLSYRLAVAARMRKTQQLKHICIFTVPHWWWTMGGP